MKARWLLAALAAAAGATAHAAPVDYSEAVSGDLPASPTTVFALDAGDNRVSGTTQLLLFHNGLHFDGDFDSFGFVVPAGEEVEAMSLSFNTLSSNVTGASIEYRLCGGACLPVETVDLLGASPAGLSFSGALPLAGGNYALSTSGLGIVVADPGIREGTGWTAGYTMTLRVGPVASPVPEPRTVLMWLLGVAVLVCGARRKRR